MDARCGFTEHRHACCVSDVCAGEFHVERIFVRRHALQDELASVSVFALVAFQRHVAQSHTHGQREQDRQRHEYPCATLQARTNRCGE